MRIQKYFTWILALFIFGFAGTSVFAQESNEKKMAELAVGRFAITGYGDFLYTAYNNRKKNDAFAGRFVPIFLYKLSDKLHAAGELEVSNDPTTGETDIELEYADIHYFLTDTTVITAGKFLLPFANFGANIHPSWINKLPNLPNVYTVHGGGSPMDGLIPVMKDFGVSVSQTLAFSTKHKVFLDVYVVNGPRREQAVANTGGGGHADGGGHGDGEQAKWISENRVKNWDTEIAWESMPSDNNKSKAVGGRIAYAYLPLLEIGASYYQGVWNDAESRNFLDLAKDRSAWARDDRYFKAGAIDIAIIGDGWKIRGEYIRTRTERIQPIPKYGSPEVPDQRAAGYFIEGSLELGFLGISFLNPVELAARYGSTKQYDKYTRYYNYSDEPSGYKTAYNDEVQEQATFGINYWFNETAVLKVAWEKNKLPYNHDQARKGVDNDRVLFQIAYGF